MRSSSSSGVLLSSAPLFLPSHYFHCSSLAILLPSFFSPLYLLFAPPNLSSILQSPALDLWTCRGQISIILLPRARRYFLDVEDVRKETLEGAGGADGRKKVVRARTERKKKINILKRQKRRCPSFECGMIPPLLLTGRDM